LNAERLNLCVNVTVDDWRRRFAAEQKAARTWAEKTKSKEAYLRKLRAVVSCLEDVLRELRELRGGDPGKSTEGGEDG